MTETSPERLRKEAQNLEARAAELEADVYLESAACCRRAAALLRAVATEKEVGSWPTTKR